MHRGAKATQQSPPGAQFIKPHQMWTRMSSTFMQARIQARAHTHPHTQSNQRRQDRHLTPADILPHKTGRRSSTAVTLSSRQEETEEDGQAGWEKNQARHKEWERKNSTDLFFCNILKGGEEKKWQARQRRVFSSGQFKSRLLFHVLDAARGDAAREQLAPQSPSTGQSQVEKSCSAALLAGDKTESIKPGMAGRVHDHPGWKQRV